MDRFILQKSSTRPNGWVLTDTTNSIVVQFEEGNFNETQHVTDLDGHEPDDYKMLAHVMREIGEWVVKYHSSIAFDRPFGLEYSEDDRHLYLYRRKSPKWRLEIFEKTHPSQLASSLRKAAEFLTKKL